MAAQIRPDNQQAAGHKTGYLRRRALLSAVSDGPVTKVKLAVALIVRLLLCVIEPISLRAFTVGIDLPASGIVNPIRDGSI